MSSHDTYSLVTTTTDSDELTELIAHTLLERRIAACIQAGPIRSFYRWDGAVHDDPETLLWIKCRTADFAEIERAIAEVHSYDEPEIIQVPISDGSADYFGWIDTETTPDRS